MSHTERCQSALRLPPSAARIRCNNNLTKAELISNWVLHIILSAVQRALIGECCCFMARKAKPMPMLIATPNFLLGHRATKLLLPASRIYQKYILFIFYIL